MALYTIVFSDGNTTVVDEKTFEWIVDHGTMGVKRVEAIVNENGENLLDKNKELMYKFIR